LAELCSQHETEKKQWKQDTARVVQETSSTIAKLQLELRSKQYAKSQTTKYFDIAASDRTHEFASLSGSNRSDARIHVERSMPEQSTKRELGKLIDMYSATTGLIRSTNLRGHHNNDGNKGGNATGVSSQTPMTNAGGNNSQPAGGDSGNKSPDPTGSRNSSLPKRQKGNEEDDSKKENDDPKKDDDKGRPSNPAAAASSGQPGPPSSSSSSSSDDESKKRRRKRKRKRKRRNMIVLTLTLMMIGRALQVRRSKIRSRDIRESSRLLELRISK
jgi:hypothetical protein